MSPRIASTFVALMLAGLTASAGAQEPANEDIARQRFEAGIELFQEGNYEGALPEFEASFRLRPVPVVQFNIAQALKMLLRYDEAIAAYRRYLEIGGATIDEVRRRDVEITIERLQQALAPLTIRCGPDGAEVRLDGRAVGHLPLLQPLQVAAGRHEVELRLPGRTSVSQTFEVRSGTPAEACLRMAEAPSRVDLHLTVATGPREPRRPGVLGQWWFWTIAGAVVAGGVTAAVLLAAPEDEEPVRGNVHPDLVSAAW
jgi:hypothetical protein